MEVPVTTVPKPFMVNTLSTGRRYGPTGAFGTTSDTISSRTLRSSSRPSPVTEETASTGASSRNVPETKSLTSSVTISSHSFSTRSFLVKTTSPFLIPRRRHISMCSVVWGIIPSSAATTRTTRSIPMAPATMFFTKRSWPGTSTTPTCRPEGRERRAKPSSIVMPRSFSSFSLSVSIPVRALTRAVFP